jgi:ribosomal protein S27E
MKRQTILDESCLLCAENESVDHLFFSCDIVKIMWSESSMILGRHVCGNYENVAKFWISNNKNAVWFLLLSCGQCGNIEMTFYFETTYGLECRSCGCAL